MKTVHDFNYKVALASGLKHLQSGRLRQAEEQFRYLISKFPRADGGYRGLARVHVELGDRAAALSTLREGASALSKAGDRAVAIDLLREAVQLDPLDLAAHRRLAATMSLAGDAAGAAQEYVRFTQGELAAGDPERAKLEAMYALETLGEIPALHELARSLGLGLRTVRMPGEAGAAASTAAASFAPTQTAALEPPLARAPIDERTALFGRAPTAPDPPVDERAALFGGAPAGPQAPVDERAALFGAPAAPQAPVDERAALFGGAPAWQPSAGPTTAPSWEAPAAETPAPAAKPAGPDALELEARAAALIARKDPGAGAAAIAAASALLDSGKTHAASDLLLAMVASGTAVHDAELELIAVAGALGRKDIATDRAKLLATVLHLAGEEERAAEVERIGLTL